MRAPVLTTPVIRALLEAVDKLDIQLARRAAPALAEEVHKFPRTMRDGLQHIEHDDTRLGHEIDKAGSRLHPNRANVTARSESDMGTAVRRLAGTGGIKETDFPFPGRLETFARPFTEEASVKVAKLQEFTKWQADAANTMASRLRALGREPTPEDWEAEYWHLTEERSKRSGLFSTADLETRITDNYPNLTWFGNEFTRKHTWNRIDEEWVRGEATRRNITYMEAAERALARFPAEGVTGDKLQTVVHLTDGTDVNGNLTLRGESAEQHFEYLRQWSAANGRDVSQWPVPTSEEAMTITATEADRQKIFKDALKQLAEPGDFATEKWAEVSFKLYESPQTKNGSDAVIRSYIVGAAEHRMGRVPNFPHDIDLRANTMTQEDFVRYVVDHDAQYGR
ncbi:hypothetical protein ACLMAJ_17435 [Nocardia sp. KC 131]|uniref:hypothetical protein n=1 Tax=Nocardia arseniciresistens TaxID=3392119 RepID=UPI00398F7B89